MLELGQQPECEILAGADKEEALREKVLEELAENDWPDLLQVVISLAKIHGMSYESLMAECGEKYRRMGGFELGAFVGKLVLQDGDEWVAYYAAEPGRFPEVTEK